MGPEAQNTKVREVQLPNSVTAFGMRSVSVYDISNFTYLLHSSNQTRTKQKHQKQRQQTKHNILLACYSKLCCLE